MTTMLLPSLNRRHELSDAEPGCGRMGSSSLPDIRAGGGGRSSMGVLSSHRHKPLRSRERESRPGSTHKAVSKTLGHLLPPDAVSAIERSMEDIDRTERGRSRGFQNSAGSQKSDGDPDKPASRRTPSSGEGRRRSGRPARVETSNEWDRRGGVFGSSRIKPTPVPAGSFTVRCPSAQDEEIISPSGFDSFDFSKEFLSEAQVERKKSNRKGWRRAAKGIAVTSGLFAAAKDKQVGARSRTRPSCCHHAFASDVVR